MYKKLATCLLLSGVSHNCMSMEAAGRAIGAVAGAVQNGYNTVSAKVNPTQVFLTVDEDWKKADDSKKITLLQKMNRGFRDGLLIQDDLTGLLNAVDATIPEDIRSHHL